MIDQIEEIKRIVRIEDIAAKAGFVPNRSGFIKSIFKDERTPSLKIYPNNSFYCWASGNGGTVIDFYSALYKVDISTAIKELKAIAGLTDESFGSRKIVQPARSIEEKPQDFNAALSEDERYFFEERFGILSESAKSEKMALSIAQNETKLFRLKKNVEVFEEFYRYATDHSRNESAFGYLINRRKIDPKAIERFRLFTFENYNQVSNHLKKKFPLDQLQRSGLFNENGNLIFFKHRILIPYLFNGRIVYLRARFFDETGSASTDSFKYLGLKNDPLDLNSPKRFFNSDILKKQPAGKIIYLVEGEFDSVIYWQNGFLSVAIAGVGNVPAEEQLNKLLRFEIKIAVDQDEAGKGLSDRLEKYFHKKNKSIHFVDLPKKDINEVLTNYYE